ncbi:MAG: hypothetical protein HKN44_01730 [Ilumatobacter sp.]|nr:hypothetical protein [Ilumatobacter sp.]
MSSPRHPVAHAAGVVRSSTVRWVAAVSGAVLVGSLLVSSPAPAAIPDGTTGEVFTDVAVLGTNSVHLHQGTAVNGAVIANDPTPVVEPLEPQPETLVPGFKVALDRTAVVTGNVAGDTVLLNRASVVTGQVAYNVLSDKGAVVGSFEGPPLALPVFPTLPPFEEASVRPDADDVAVGVNATEFLAPGEHGAVTIAKGGTLILTGGEYHIRSLVAGRDASIEFEGATDLKVAERFEMGQNGQVGPASGASIDASDIVVYVGAGNGGDGGPGGIPASAHIGKAGDISANLYVARGTAQLDRDTSLNGSVIARDVVLNRNVAVTEQSAYGNNAPIAVPQVVADDTEVRVGNEPVPVPITLEANDPDGDALTFTLVSLPGNGTLAEGGTAIAGPAPVTLGGNALEYTPTGTIDENFADSFTFEADDGDLTSNVATVEVRGPEDDANPPGVVGIDAKDDTIETTEAVEIVLNAAAADPIGDLTFAIVTPPNATDGTLGAVADVPDSPARSATVTFTPTGGFAGDTSFVFEACEVAAPTNCDEATVGINVNALTPPAPPPITNVGAQLTEGGEVEIDLQLGNGQVGPQPPPGGEEGRQSFAGPALRQALPMNTTVDDEAAFLALLSSSTTFDFEVASGFPDSAATLIECIPSGATGSPCPTGDVYFDAFIADRPAAPSPVQGMRGTNLPAPADGPAGIHFDALTAAPNAFGFFADVGANAPSDTINVTINYTDESSEVVSVDVSDSSTSSGGQIYFGFVNDSTSIYSIELQGKDAAGDDSEFFIDDLTIGTGTEPAQTTLDSTIAWNVADTDFDGDGDASNADGGGFPGAPGLISASNNTTGGPGSQGNARVHIEYDIANLSGVVDAAEVTVHTSPGTSGLDTLPTFFYAATGDGDGVLTNSDFETVATQVSAVLPNETGIESFTFDVTEELQAAIDAGFDWFVIQGRVVESPLSTNPGGERGMQIKSQCATCGGGPNPPDLSVRFASTAQPDLVVDSLTHDPASPTTEDNIEFTAVVKNVGSAAADESTLSFKIGGESPSAPEALFAVPALAPGETFEVVRTTSLIAQNYVNTAVADFAEDVAESNEANNTATDTYTVTAAVETKPVLGTFKITALPAIGTLYTSQGTPISSVPTTLPDTMVTYVAGPGALVGMVDQFEFSATNSGGLTTNAYGYVAVVADLVIFDSCLLVGRPPGCTP